MGHDAELTFEALAPGLRFAPQEVTITPAQLAGYAEALGADSSAGEDVVPPGFAGILARRSYLSGYRMPPGGVLLSQSVIWSAPARLGGPLRVEAGVRSAREHKSRRIVVIDTLIFQIAREPVATVETVVSWP
jgi:hypothetical protein